MSGKFMVKFRYFTHNYKFNTSKAAELKAKLFFWELQNTTCKATKDKTITLCRS